MTEYYTQDRAVEGAAIGALAGGVTGGPGGALIGGVLGAAMGTQSYRDPLPREQKQISEYFDTKEGKTMSVQNVKKKLEGVLE